MGYPNVFTPIELLIAGHIYKFTVNIKELYMIEECAGYSGKAIAMLMTFCFVEGSGSRASVGIGSSQREVAHDESASADKPKAREVALVRNRACFQSRTVTFECEVFP